MKNIEFSKPLGPWNTVTVTVDGEPWGKIRDLMRGGVQLRCDVPVFPVTRNGKTVNLLANGKVFANILAAKRDLVNWI